MSFVRRELDFFFFGDGVKAVDGSRRVVVAIPALSWGSCAGFEFEGGCAAGCFGHGGEGRGGVCYLTLIVTQIRLVAE